MNHSVDAGAVWLLDQHLKPQMLAQFTDNISVARATPHPDGRVAVMTMPVGGPYDGVVRIFDVHARVIATRDWTGRSARDCVWLGDELVVSLSNSERTVAAEVWSGDLATLLNALSGNVLGLAVDAGRDVVAVSGAELCLWRPTDETTFFFYASGHAPPGEMGDAVLSRDGRFAAVVHDAIRTSEPQFVILATEGDPHPLSFSDGTVRHADELAFSPNGELLAVRMSGSGVKVSPVEQGKMVQWKVFHPPIVRIHQTSDGAVIAEKEGLAPRAIGWLDDETLLTGGDTLTTWRW